jgi:UDP-arabinose 4-epimerase
MTDAGTVLVTGGAGYIGSHTCKMLSRAGLKPVTYDNLSLGHRHAVKWGPLVVGDIRDQSRLIEAIREHKPAAVIHFAASAYVGESVQSPAKYYDNNVRGTLSLLEAMRSEGVPRIVFSSTCATYGIPSKLPITEEMPQAPVNPYGWTKRMIEQALEDYSHAYGLRFAALRYFNASGADPDGEIGEEHDPEPHLIPRAIMASLGIIPHMDVFGDDYDTPDGTCIRDYIHVEDLAQGHVLALRHLELTNTDIKLNLGTGNGFSVRQILAAVEQVAGRPVPVKIGPRRPGDPPALYADIARARALIGFEPRFTDVHEIVRTAYAYFSRRERPA